MILRCSLFTWKCDILLDFVVDRTPSVYIIFPSSLHLSSFVHLYRQARWPVIACRFSLFFAFRDVFFVSPLFRGIFLKLR